MADLIGSLNALRLAVEANTVALKALLEEETIVDQDVQALVGVAQQLASGESELKTDLDALVAAIGTASIPAGDKAAIQQAVADLQATFGKIQADAQEAVAATSSTPPSPTPPVAPPTT